MQRIKKQFPWLFVRFTLRDGFGPVTIEIFLPDVVGGLLGAVILASLIGAMTGWNAWAGAYFALVGALTGVLGARLLVELACNPRRR